MCRIEMARPGRVVRLASLERTWIITCMPRVRSSAGGVQMVCEWHEDGVLVA